MDQHAADCQCDPCAIADLAGYVAAARYSDRVLAGRMPEIAVPATPAAKGMVAR